jgi:hypothetical protein
MDGDDRCIVVGPGKGKANIASRGAKENQLAAQQTGGQLLPTV